LKLVARYADIWNNLGAFHREVGAKLEVLRGHCQRVGRASTRSRSLSRRWVRSASPATRRAADRGGAPGGRLPDRRPGALSHGTPDEIVSRLRESVQRGISSFVISFGRHAGAESLRLFAREVIRPSVSRRAGRGTGRVPVLPPVLRSHVAKRTCEGRLRRGSRRVVSSRPTAAPGLGHRAALTYSPRRSPLARMGSNPCATPTRGDHSRTATRTHQNSH